MTHSTLSFSDGYGETVPTEYIISLASRRTKRLMAAFIAAYVSKNPTMSDDEKLN